MESENWVRRGHIVNGLPFIVRPMKTKGRRNLNAKNGTSFNGTSLPIELPDLEQFATFAVSQVAAGNFGNQIEYAAIGHRPQKLDVFRVSPHKRHGRTRRLAQE